MTKKSKRGGKRPGSGRPPSDDPRDQIIGTRLTKGEFAVVRTAADALTLSVSAYTRMVLLKKVRT